MGLSSSVRKKESTQEVVLDAAERLFGRHGVDAVSLREIAVAAGSSNHFVVQYHFGDKARLIREILPKAHLATVYAKPAGRPLVDTFVTEVSQDTWINFPWDLQLAFAPPIGKAGAACLRRQSRSSRLLSMISVCIASWPTTCRRTCAVRQPLQHSGSKRKASRAVIYASPAPGAITC